MNIAVNIELLNKDGG